MTNSRFCPHKPAEWKHVTSDATGDGGANSESAVAKLVARLGQYMGSIRLVSIETPNARGRVRVCSGVLGFTFDDVRWRISTF